MSLPTPTWRELDDGRLELILPEDESPPEAYEMSAAQVVMATQEINYRRGLQVANRELGRQLSDALRAPHLEYAPTRMLIDELRARVWNVERSGKRVRPTNGHGTWLPLYWIFGANDRKRSVQLRFMREIDRPYRAGYGIGVRVPGGRLFEFGACHRRNLEPDPEQYGDYDDPGATDALQARVLDDGIADISLKYRSPNAAAPQATES